MSATEPLVHPHYIRSEALGNEITELCLRQWRELYYCAKDQSAPTRSAEAV